MKLDIFKAVDILAVAFVAIGWSHPLWAQTDDAIVKDCNEQSVLVSGSDPLKAVDAQVAAFQNCVAGRIPNVQRRTLSLHRNWQAFCNKSADNDMKRDPLTTTAERAELFKKCMASRDYVVQ